MELILNDLSIHQQFEYAPVFREAINRLMDMRKIAREFGRELYCHRTTVNREIAPSLSVHGAVQTQFALNERRVLMAWLNKHGPFWNDVPYHNSDDWFESNGEIVTETALGEAAFCATTGIDRRVVSLSPSDWEHSPVTVTRLNGTAYDIEVQNYWALSELKSALLEAAPPIASWIQLEAACSERFQRLTFSVDCFRPLDGQPFAPMAARHIQIRLEILDRLMGLVDNTGQRTPEGHQLYQQHFHGDKAWFSDSSDTEKHRYRQDLTFRHPTTRRMELFCPWHGKLNNPPFRIHFAWPESSGAPLYVAYVGQKITMQ